MWVYEYIWSYFLSGGGWVSMVPGPFQGVGMSREGWICLRWVLTPRHGSSERSGTHSPQQDAGGTHPTGILSCDTFPQLCCSSDRVGRLRSVKLCDKDIDLMLLGLSYTFYGSATVVAFFRSSIQNYKLILIIYIISVRKMKLFSQFTYWKQK